MAVVLLEAPHRMEAVARALQTLAQRPVTVAREMTKQFEQIVSVPCAGLLEWLQSDAQRMRGEFVLVVHPQATVQHDGDGERVLALLLDELPLKTAVRLAADITGRPRNGLYEQALRLKADRPAG